jgi:hypothetical protein
VLAMISVFPTSRLWVSLEQIRPPRIRVLLSCKQYTLSLITDCKRIIELFQHALGLRLDIISHSNTEERSEILRQLSVRASRIVTTR